MEGSTIGDGKTVLLLGGYGRAGLPLAELLLRETSVRLIVAGRDGGRADEVARRLSSGHPWDRVEGMCVDASDASALEAAFRRCDLATICAPLTGIGPRVIEAALNARIDYVGINVEPAAQAEIEALSVRVEQAGLRFITDAGLVPGVPAALARWAALRFDRVEEMTVGLLMREKSVSYGSAADLVAATSVPSTLYEKGEWRRAPLTATRSLDFGPTFGRCTCYPADLPELHPLPVLLRLERVRAYVAGVNGFTNALAGAWYLLGLGRFPWGVRLGATLLVRAMGRTRPPFGTVLMLETLGEAGGQRQRLRVAYEHEDGWLATAIPTLACLLQLLDGTLESPGIHMMGHAVDVDRFFGDMERLGMKPTQTADRLQNGAG
jgi:NAD(P)-dependent dehydrogenase (short-subunit alcohol dehydrogenase family)